MMNAVTNLPLKDQIAAILRREIASGNMADGEELTQENIATALAVSRIPVREAFLQLESEGLLRRLPNRHVQVVGLTEERRSQNFRIMAAFEREVATLLAESWNTELPLAQFETLQTGLGEELMNRDERFHLAMSQALNNPTLGQLHAIHRRSLFTNAARKLPEETVIHLDSAIAESMRRQDLQALCAAIQTYYDGFSKEPNHETTDTD